MIDILKFLLSKYGTELGISILLTLSLSIWLQLTSIAPILVLFWFVFMLTIVLSALVEKLERLG